jgi:SAM-dependent methyltransferase
MAAVGIRDEVKKYSNISVNERGDIDVYEKRLFRDLIRRKELEIILPSISSWSPKLILDYGCGAGWLSALLNRCKGFDVVGVDISPYLLKNAKKLCSRAEFIACDAEKLPFKGSTFDCVVGIAILHHLRLERSCKEINGVLCEESTFIFMEPNSLNPLSALGRRFFPTKAHTKGEGQFVPSHLKTVLSQTGLVSERYFNLFFFSFPLARLFKIAKIRPRLLLIRMASSLENLMQIMPGMKQLNSTIVAIGKSERRLP